MSLDLPPLMITF